MEKLSGKVAVVTGGGRGIGAAVAKQLSQLGATVYVVSRTESEVKKVAEEITALGKNCQFAVCDVSDEKSVREFFERVDREQGKLDILVNNAGAILNAKFDEQSVEEWDRVLGVNVRGVFLFSRQAFKRMKSNGGSIVNVGSLAGIRATEKFPGFSAYVTSKHAVVGLTEAMAAEGKECGVRVTCVAPGAVDTDMLKKAAPGLRAETTPSQVGEIITYLASENANIPLNGSIIEVHCNA